MNQFMNSLYAILIFRLCCLYDPERYPLYTPKARIDYSTHAFIDIQLLMPDIRCQPFEDAKEWPRTLRHYDSPVSAGVGI